MIKLTYFVHGTTTDNSKHISSGWGDADLSPLGIQQSIDLKKLIKDQNFDIIFCSDLKRSIHSARLTFGDSHNIIQDKRLREMNYGDYNAKPSSIVEPLQRKNINTKFPNGESCKDVEKRIKSFLEYLKKKDTTGKM